MLLQAILGNVVVASILSASSLYATFLHFHKKLKNNIKTAIENIFN